MLLSQGYTWISSVNLRALVKPDTGAPQAGEMEVIPSQQDLTQPFVYPSGLVEVPMSLPSDVGTMRTGRWKLADFRKGVELGLNWCIEHGKVFDLLSHPSAIGVADPHFEVIDLIIDTVQRAGRRARLVGVDTIAHAYGAHLA